MLNKLTIDRSSGQPVSQQIARFIRGLINKGQLLPGDKLPTTKEMIKDFSMGASTIRLAMSELEKEGLVKSLRRRGTFVTHAPQEITQDQENQRAAKSAKQFRYIGILGLVHFIPSQENYGYHRETSEGINLECNRHNACAISLPCRLLELSKEEIYQELIRLDCDGLIWAGMDRDDVGLTTYLLEKKMPLLVSRSNQTRDDVPAIAMDYDGAGFDVALYFNSTHTDKVLLINHVELNDALGHDTYGVASGLKHGITKGFEGRGVAAEIEVCVSCQSPNKNSEVIFEKIRALPSTSGIVFSEGHQLYQLFVDYGQLAVELLQDRKLVAVSNKITNNKLAPFTKELDLMTLIGPHEEVGQMMVGKLMGIIEGYYTGASTTLAKIKFQRFDTTLQ